MVSLSFVCLVTRRNPGAGVPAHVLWWQLLGASVIPVQT